MTSIVYCSLHGTFLYSPHYVCIVSLIYTSTSGGLCVLHVGFHGNPTFSFRCSEKKGLIIYLAKTALYCSVKPVFFRGSTAIEKDFHRCGLYSGLAFFFFKQDLTGFVNDTSGKMGKRGNGT